MILVSEFVNLVWTFAAFVLGIGGYAIFNFSQTFFFKYAIGLPIIVISVSVFLFKIHELILVIFRPKRLEAICVLCGKK